jgi:hypothetical protein
MGGYTLAHELTHYVYNVRDEYQIDGWNGSPALPFRTLMGDYGDWVLRIQQLTGHRLNPNIPIRDEITNEEVSVEQFAIPI